MIHKRIHTVLLGLGVLIAAAILYLIQIPPRPRTPAHVIEITTRLWAACDFLRIAVVDKPGGGGRRTMSEAIQYVTDIQSNTPAFWRYAHSDGTNGFIHVNPDFEKWRVKATNELDEIAAFCGAHVLGADGTHKVFIGITFNYRRVELTNALPWQSATEWLSINSSNMATHKK
jgi:hypothetical protein